MFFLLGFNAVDSITASWYRVIIRTCDGGSYFSDTTAQYKGKTMNFKGSRNVLEAVNYLNSIKWLQNREEILIAGAQNGGLAALAWADYIKGFTKGKVKVLADAAIW
jgi:hypothetical protein